MRRRLLAPAVVVAFVAGAASASGAGAGGSDLEAGLGDQFTAVLAGFVGDELVPVPGTDGRWHVVYELELTNAKHVPATIEGVEVLDLDHPDRVLRSFSGKTLTADLFELSGHPREKTRKAGAVAELAPGESALVFVELAFGDRAEVPDRIVHRLTGRAATNPGSESPEPIRYLVAPRDLSRREPIALGPPLAGGGWLAVNGCCRGGAHRGAVQTVNGALINSQRFAIDWLRVGPGGKLFAGDRLEDAPSWYCYGQPVLAVADGTVIATESSLDDQPVGTLPDPKTITLQTVDGNHVILDLGNGVYAFYAHLVKGSVAVEPGDRVRKGQELGRLGNSGNTSAPHLHFHLMNGPSAIASDSLPYVFESFTLEGRVDPAQWYESDDLGDALTILADEAGPRSGQLPLDLQVVELPAGD